MIIDKEDIKLINSINRSKDIVTKRREIFENFASKYVPEQYKDAFIKYLEHMNNESRLDFLDSLIEMIEYKRLSKLEDLFEEDLEEMGKEFFGDMVEEERDVKDVFDFKTNEQSYLIIYTAFANKLRELVEKGIKLNPYYIKYTKTDIKKLKLKEEPYKSKVYIGFKIYLLKLPLNKRQQFIRDLFNPEYQLVL